MKRILVLSAVVAAIALLVYIIHFRNRPAPQTVDSLEELRALPYVQWSAPNADPGKKGVTLHDAARAFQGFNLTSNLVDEIYLLDMDGHNLHTWRIPKKLLIDDAVVLEDGSLVVSAVDDFLKVDWDSRILWRTGLPSHHDISRLADGSFLTLVRDHHSYKNHNMNFDGIAAVSGAGQLLFKWTAFENLDEIKALHKPSPLEVHPQPGLAEGEYDYYHMNTIKPLPATRLGQADKRFQQGNLMTCFRNVDLIAILDKDSWKIVWSWGTEALDWPHAPTMLEDGHILIFDNGIHRGFTRVLEIDPATGRITWEYKGSPRSDFYSNYRGAAQRLPNGNTLICEAARGRVFEIDRENRLAWEYWNPEIRRGKRQGISFFRRLMPETVKHLPVSGL